MAVRSTNTHATNTGAVQSPAQSRAVFVTNSPVRPMWSHQTGGAGGGLDLDPVHRAVRLVGTGAGGPLFVADYPRLTSADENRVLDWWRRTR